MNAESLRTGISLPGEGGRFGQRRCSVERHPSTMEKTMSSGTGLLEEKFRDGVRLSSGGDYDGADPLLLECVIAAPENAAFAEAFLGHLRQKYREAKGSQAAGEAERSKLEQAWAERNWAEIFGTGARCLAGSPAHVPALLAMADACEAHGYYDTELVYLNAALEAAAEDAQVNRRAGRSLVRMRRLEEALACWRRVASAAPEDAEAARTVSKITIEISRRNAGLEVHRSAEPEASAKNNEQRQSGVAPGSAVRPDRGGEALEARKGSARTMLNPVQQLEVAIRDHPANPQSYLELAPLYLERDRDYDAERLLAKGKEATADPRVLQMWEDVTMIRAEKKIALAHKEAELNDTPQSRATLAQLRAERDRWEIEVFTGRCQREPGNLAWRYELGLRLKRAGKVHAAIEKFKEALLDSAKKPDAAFQLGECSQQFYEYAEALRYYRLAAESARESHQLARRKEALYRAGELAARVKLRKPAQRYLDELLRIDSTYQDAAGLLENLGKTVV